MKGIGIVLMVLRHARAPYSDFVLLFHMAIFFIASGYLYNQSYADSINSVAVFVWKKVKSLYIPYICYTVIFILLNNLFLRINIYTDNPAFLQADFGEATYVSLGSYFTIETVIKQIVNAAAFRAGTQVGGAFWFFQTMFLVLVGYTIVEYIIRKITLDEKKQMLIQSIVAIAFLLVGYWCHVTGHSLKGMSRVFSVYILIHLGIVIKQYSVMQRMKKIKPWMTLILAFFILLIGYHRGYIALDGNNIENPLFYIVMSLAGWFMLYSVAEILVQNKWKINSVLIYIGIHSIPIIALHFLCFKIVNLVAVNAYGMEKYMIAAFPVLMLSGAWWIAYTIVGLSVPLILRKIFFEMKDRIGRYLL